MSQGSPTGQAVKPFLKWPGGKRWAAPEISAAIKVALGEDSVYFEPFLGGGAIFFHLRPKRAVLSDINANLIATYSAVRDHTAAVLQHLREFPVDREMYYSVRAQEWSCPVETAAATLYLNRTAFGGLYRLNKKGRFNVPYGGGSRTPQILCDGSILARASASLALAELRVSDFEPVMDQACCGDVIYCDPTYTVAHKNNGFVRYNESNFSWADQERLARAAFRARGRGVTVLISNADHPSILALYPDAQVQTLCRISRVSPRPEMRKAVSEYLLILHP